MVFDDYGRHLLRAATGQRTAERSARPHARRAGTDTGPGGHAPSARSTSTRSRATTIGAMELKTLHDWQIKYQLRAVPGVSRHQHLGRRNPAVRGRGRPEAAAGATGSRCATSSSACARTTTTSAAASSSTPPSSTPCADSAARATRGRPGADRAGGAPRHARAICATWPRSASARCRGRAPSRATARAKRSPAW